MKKSSLCPELQSARRILLSALNDFMKHGSASEGIGTTVPVIMPILHVDYKITHNDKINQYGCKVELMCQNQKLTIKF